MELREKQLTHSQHNDGDIPVWIDHFAPKKNLLSGVPFPVSFANFSANETKANEMKANQIENSLICVLILSAFPTKLLPASPLTSFRMTSICFAYSAL